MLARPLLFSAVIAALTLSGCATKQKRKLPKWERPISKTEFQTVRTTAYTHSEADHIQYGRNNAIGTTLQSAGMKSASADWGRWPMGTVFRVLDTGETYVVDDYGWALAGTNTIDLYKSSRSDMNRWGVRKVDIQILHWGSPEQSYAVLAPRQKHRHVERMVKELRGQM